MDMSGISSNTLVQGAAAVGIAIGGGFLGHAIHQSAEHDSLKARDRQVTLKEAVASGQLNPGQVAGLPSDARNLLEAKTPSVARVRGETTLATTLMGGAGLGAAIIGVPVMLLSGSNGGAMAAAAVGAAAVGVAIGGFVAHFGPPATS